MMPRFWKMKICMLLGALLSSRRDRETHSERANVSLHSGAVDDAHGLLFGRDWKQQSSTLGIDFLIKNCSDQTVWLCVNRDCQSLIFGLFRSGRFDNARSWPDQAIHWCRVLRFVRRACYHFRNNFYCENNLLEYGLQAQKWTKNY